MDVLKLSAYPKETLYSLFAIDEIPSDTIIELIDNAGIVAESLGASVDGEWVWDRNNPSATKIMQLDRFVGIMDNILAAKGTTFNSETNVDIFEALDTLQPAIAQKYNETTIKNWDKQRHRIRPEWETEMLNILAGNAEFIRLSTLINEYNPSQVYQREMNTNALGIHRKDGGPCPDDLNSMDVRQCQWAQACIKARSYVNMRYQHAVPILRSLIDSMDKIVNDIGKNMSASDNGRLTAVYEKYYKNTMLQWINNMQSSIAGHEQAKNTTIAFRTACRQMYARQALYTNRKRHWKSGEFDGETIKAAATDLLHNYTDSDMRTMALHFGIPDILTRENLAYQLAVIFFGNV